QDILFPRFNENILRKLKLKILGEFRRKISVRPKVL
ncbi:unnamed protein product, partial [Brassica oleracea var. botrytis]